MFHINNEYLINLILIKSDLKWKKNKIFNEKIQTHESENID